MATACKDPAKGGFGVDEWGVPTPCKKAIPGRIFRLINCDGQPLTSPNMKTIIRIVLAFAVIAALIAAYIGGRNDVRLTEFKECQAHLLILTQWETNQPPELKEYVKARYYYLANRLPKYYVEPAKNYGPVGTNVAHVAVFKEPTSGQGEYLEFLQRFNLPKN